MCPAFQVGLAWSRPRTCWELASESLCQTVLETAAVISGQFHKVPAAPTLSALSMQSSLLKGITRLRSTQAVPRVSLTLPICYQSSVARVPNFF